MDHLHIQTVFLKQPLLLRHEHGRQTQRVREVLSLGRSLVWAPSKLRLRRKTRRLELVIDDRERFGRGGPCLASHKGPHAILPRALSLGASALSEARRAPQCDGPLNRLSGGYTGRPLCQLLRVLRRGMLRRRMLCWPEKHVPRKEGVVPVEGADAPLEAAVRYLTSGSARG